MTNEKTDNTDEPTKAELHDRVQKLESTVAKMMPSRRDALKLGAAGVAGAAGLGAASQPADASTGSAGTIGSSGSRPDLLADEVDANKLTIPTLTIPTTGGTNLLLDTDSGKTELIQQETTVSNTSSTKILSDPDGFSMVGMVVVQVDAGSGNRATDLVLAQTQSGDISTISSVTIGSPPTRSYGATANDDLTISLGSGSAEVTAIGFTLFA